MSTTFTEFLRQKAAKHKDEDEGIQAVLAEWRESILRLHQQIREWLKISDPDGILKIKQSEKDVTEPRLGNYKAPDSILRASASGLASFPRLASPLAKHIHRANRFRIRPSAVSISQTTCAATFCTGSKKATAMCG